MRVPTVRFGNDGSPIETWVRRYRPVRTLALILTIIAWAIAAVLALTTLMLADSLARAVLPRRLRGRYWHAGARNPRKCPACGAALAVTEVRIPSRLEHPKDGRPLPWVVYEGSCPGCARAFRWVNLGKVAPVLDEIRS